MSDAVDVVTTGKSKYRSASAGSAPKFELPNFDLPKMELPAAFREIAEKGVTQAKETYEKIKTVAEEATDLLEGTYATATKGVSDYGLKLIEVARENTNSAFDFASRLITVTSLSEAVELSAAHTRKRYEAVSVQTRELASIVQKAALDTLDPVKQSFGKVFKLP